MLRLTAITKCVVFVLLLANKTIDYIKNSPYIGGGSIKQEVLSDQHPNHALEELIHHSEIFDKKKILKVGNDSLGVYVAVGYAMANMALIEGREEIVIVDTTESPETATEILLEFGKITSKPCKAVVITHYHADHYYGLNAVLDFCSKNSDVPPKVITHSSTIDQLSRFLEAGIISFKRAHRQFGHYLEADTERINCGIGLELKLSPQEAFEYSDPTLTFEHNLTVVMSDGEELQFFHTPGETNDQITLWLPQRKTVFPGDNIYEAFPAVYTLRGAANRDIKKWYESIDLVRDLNPQYLVPSHTNPVSGFAEVEDILTVYRDGLQFVHDQTLRWMNKGLNADEMVEKIHLPPSLAGHRYLQEFYGTVEGAVRSIYQGYYGWFDGDPANIDPISKSESISRWGSLLSSDGDVNSGYDIMLDDAANSLMLSKDNSVQHGEHLVEELQWCMELTSHVMLANNLPSAMLKDTKSLAADCMRQMADATINAQQRNYYLTSAKELDSGLKIESSSEHKVSLIMEVGMDQLMSFFPVRIRSETCVEGEVITVAVEFPDLNTIYYLTIRNCIMEINKSNDLIDVDCKLTLPSLLWRKLIAKQIGFGLYYALGKIRVSGTASIPPYTFKRFMEHFDVVD